MTGITIYLERTDWQRSRKHELSAADVGFLTGIELEGHAEWPPVLQDLIDDLGDSLPDDE